VFYIGPGRSLPIISWLARSKKRIFYSYNKLTFQDNPGIVFCTLKIAYVTKTDHTDVVSRTTGNKWRMQCASE